MDVGRKFHRPLDPKDLEIARLEREVAALRERERNTRAEARDARKHFADLTQMSKRFTASVRTGAGERQQQRRRLAAQYAISQVLATARGLDDAAPKIYEILGERLGWHAGALWTVDEEASPAVLRHRGTWRSSGSAPSALEEASEPLALRRGVGLPGRVWERGEPVCIEDLSADGGKMPRAQAAARDGLRGALAFPVVDGGFVGVFELFRREVLPPDEDMMRTAALVGGQIGQFLERRRAEDERDLALSRERQARERASGILESINDAFFTLDAERRFTYVNNRAEELWGRTREGLLGRSMWEVFPRTIGSEPYRAVERALAEDVTAEFEAVSPVLGIWISGRVYPSGDGVSVLFHSIEERKRAEEALKKNEARWRTLVAKGADVITISDRDGTVRFASPSIETVCGYGVEEFVGTNPFQAGHFHPDDLERCEEAFRDLADDPGGSAEIQHRYRHASGEWRWLEGSFTNLFEDPAVGGLVANFRDVTERKRAEEAIRESEEKYRTLYDSMDEGYAVVEVMPDENGAWRDFLFLEVNPAFEKQTGMADAAGRRATEILGTPNPAWARIYGRVAETGEPVRFEEREPTLDRIFDLYAFRLDGAGSRRVAVLFSDVTERRRAEAALRESESRLSAIFSRAAVGLCELSPDGSFVMVNDELCGLLGRTREELLTTGVREVTHPEDAAETVARFGRLMEDGEPFSVDKRYVRPDGTVVWANSALTRLDDEEGRPRGALAVVADLTERKRREAHQAFLLKLSDALRPLADPAEIQNEAIRVLGEHLGVDRALYSDVDESGETHVISNNYVRGDYPALIGSFPTSAFGEVSAGLRAGETVVVADVTADERLAEATRAAFIEAGVYASIGVPLIKGGRWVANFGVHHGRPRHWTDEDVALIEETAERTWAAVVRARAEEALREREEELRLITDNVPALIAFLDREERYRFVNAAYPEFLGEPRERILGRTIREQLGERAYERLRPGIERVLAGERVSFEDMEPDKHGPGLHGWTEENYIPLFAPDGAVTGFFVLALDITERKRTEEALRESRALLEKAISTETVGVLFFGLDGRVTDANEAFARMSGYGREELLDGMDWETLTPPEFEGVTARAAGELATLGETAPYEKQMVRKDGSRWWGLFAPTRISGSGEDSVCVEFILDINERKRAEAALRASEERFRAIADLVPDLLWSNDASGETSWYNERWYEYTGQNVGEAQAYGWLYTVHPDDREEALQAFLDAVDAGHDFRREHRIRGRDGLYRWFLLQARPIRDDEGRILRWFGAATDVHEQRVALEALKESEERYRSLADATSSIVWAADRDGSVVEEMPAWEEFTGQAYEEYRGFGWLRALHPDDRSPETLRGELSSSDPAQMEEEYRLLHRSGEYRRVVFRGVPLVDEGGETREWIGTVFDVEDARRAEEEREGLRRQTERERARLEGLLQQIPGGVFIAEPSGRFILANEGARRIYGREIGTLEECQRHTVSYPDGEETVPERSSVARALAGETVSGTEYYVVRPDGSRRIVSANAAPVLDERGEVVAAVKVFEDVTGRKRAEAERDRLQERERAAREAAEEAERRLAFYAGAREERQIIGRELHDRVAHSMAVVRQNLELYEVLKGRDPDAASRKMELAKEEAKASLRSTRDLSMMLRRSEVEDGLSNALAGLEGTTVPEGVSYESGVTGDESLVPPHVGNQVFLVLREGVRNAINHSECAHVAVRLRITEERLVGTVEDDGRGFDPERARAGGGLRSMEERVRLVGGEFRLRSTPEGGTRIEVSVPLGRDGA